METKKLEWDSAFFGFPVGDIFLESSTKKQLLNNNLYQFIQVRSLHPTDIVSDTHLITHQETKVIFSKTLDNITQEVKDITDFDLLPISEECLHPLALESGKYSRYALDPSITKNKFHELYYLWIKNSINKSFADKIFYFEENNEILGFVTFKIKQKIAQIGLIAVAPQAQGKGLGKKLLQQTERYCATHHVLKILIPTQLENTNACSFYKKMNYTITEHTIIKHLWRK